MTVNGHLLLANNALVFLIPNYTNVLNSYSYYDLMIFYCFFFFGAVIVDIDEPNSYIGKRLFFLSYPFKLFNIIAKLLISLFTNNKLIHRVFEHRGLTHMFIFTVIIYSLSFVFDTYISICIKFLAFGVLMHQLGDLITNTGIRNYLFPIPISNVKSFITFKTDGIIESIIKVILLFMLILQIYFYFGEGIDY